MSTLGPLRPDDHMRIIEIEIQARVERYISEETDRAITALTTKIRGEADALAIKLLSYYSVEERAGHVVITVNKKDK